MSRIHRIDRRTLLSGIGGSLLVPMLGSLSGCNHKTSPSGGQEPLGKAYGAAGFPRRVVFFYTPNGNYNMPTTLDFAGSSLEPLSGYANRISLIQGMNMESLLTGPGEPHQRGMAMLTGRGLNQGSFIGGDGQLAGWGAGLSVDQRIAQAIGKESAYRSLHLGVQSTIYGGTEVRTVLSYRGSDEPVANETSPYTLSELVFGELALSPEQLAELRARRKSVLDAVSGQFDALMPKMSQGDKKKLDQHLTSIRELENKLDKPLPSMTECDAPALGDPVDLHDPTNFPAVGKMHMDLLAMSLACDLTRVATLQWSSSVNNRPYPWLSVSAGEQSVPIDGDEHAMGHQPDSATAIWKQLEVIRKWYSEQLLYFLNRLAEIPEGEGTVLDNTVVVLISDISRGNTHSQEDMPFMIAGDAGGAFKSGQVLSEPGRSHNDLLLTLLHGFGIELDTFGDPDFCSGPLSGLLT